jgi:hypothetical protein
MKKILTFSLIQLFISYWLVAEEFHENALKNRPSIVIVGKLIKTEGGVVLNTFYNEDEGEKSLITLGIVRVKVIVEKIIYQHEIESNLLIAEKDEFFALGDAFVSRKTGRVYGGIVDSGEEEKIIVMQYCPLSKSYFVNYLLPKSELEHVKGLILERMKIVESLNAKLRDEMLDGKK